MIESIKGPKTLTNGGKCMEMGKMVRSPGFEPGSSAWQADVLAKLDYDRSNVRLRILAVVT